MSNSPAYLPTIALFEEFSDNIVYRAMDESEALQAAVDWAFRDRDEDFRSDLYAKITEAWGKLNDRLTMRFATTENIVAAAL